MLKFLPSLPIQIFALAAIICLYTVPVSADKIKAIKDNNLLTDITEIKVPALPGAREPAMAVTGDGNLFLSWLEPISRNAYACLLYTSPSPRD